MVSIKHYFFHCFKMKQIFHIYTTSYTIAVLKLSLPAIAQLVERLTVEVTQLSGGPWFESVLPDYFFKFRSLIISLKI